MVTISAALALCSLITYGGGVTKTSGIEQFWTDDFKAFEQVYGKTSDRDLYGATLPPSVTFTLDVPKSEIKASEKKERYLSDKEIGETEQQLYPYAFGDRYAKLFAKSTLKPTKKKPSAGLKFVGGDYKPISESNDPETYKYLKHLENHQKYELNEDVSGFQPFLNYNLNTELEDTDAYKSIQDILDAHEANKGTKQIDVDYDKYLRYGTSKGRSKVRLSKGNSNSLTSGVKSRCRAGRCRKRNSSSYRVGARPYLRRIKHRIIDY